MPRLRSGELKTPKRFKMVDYTISSEDTKNLLELKNRSNLDFDVKNEFESIEAIIKYVHDLSGHNSDGYFEKNDPVSIYLDVLSGKQMRCVEFSALASALLRAFGVKSRIIGLKTEDVETREYGAGHVVVEFWSNDFMKWVMVDVQHAVMAYSHDEPLSVLELRNRLYAGDKTITIKNLSKQRKDFDYLSWIYEYLFFIDTTITQDFSAHDKRHDKILMLVPEGVNRPKIFQNSFQMNVIHTEDPEDFYKS